MSDLQNSAKIANAVIITPTYSCNMLGQWAETEHVQKNCTIITLVCTATPSVCQWVNGRRVQLEKSSQTKHRS